MPIIITRCKLAKVLLKIRDAQKSPTKSQSLLNISKVVEFNSLKMAIPLKNAKNTKKKAKYFF